MSDEREYRHMEYGLVVTCERDLATIRFYKKSWVPTWIWKLLATPDYIDLCNAALNRGTEKQKQELFEAIAAPMNEKMKEESAFAKTIGLKREDYPEKLNEAAGGATKEREGPGDER